MNISRKGLLIAINSFAFAGSVLWYFFQPGFEPIITAIVLFATLVALIVINPKEAGKSQERQVPIQENNNAIHINNYNGATQRSETTLAPRSSLSTQEELDKRKKLTQILFVDDDTKFKIIKILNKAGWNTKIIKDIDNLDAPIVQESHILFVDIHGVGILLGCKDEGLGLAHSLKRKYPDKKVIIYSTDSTGDRFHEALRSVDTFLSKNAEPFEFQELIEQYSAEVSLV